MQPCSTSSPHDTPAGYPDEPDKDSGCTTAGQSKMSRVGLSSHLPMYELSPDFTMKPANTRKGKRGDYYRGADGKSLLIPEDTA